MSKGNIPQMFENSGGHIVNVGFSVGKEVNPKGNFILLPNVMQTQFLKAC